MGCKSVVVLTLVICGLLLYSCALFYKSIPPIEFSVDRDNSDLELDVISMSRGSHEKREGGVIVASNISTKCDINFMVRSGTQTSQFVTRTSGNACLKGALSGVVTTYAFGGGMWIASRSACDYGHYEISGVPASPESFVVGRVVHENHKLVPLIERVAPHTGVEFDSQSSGVFLTGRGGASVLASGFANPGKILDIYAASGSFLLIEQVDGGKELNVGSSLPLRVVMRPGRAKIVWFPAGSDESHVEVIIDAVSEEDGYGGCLSFSSMLDK